MTCAPTVNEAAREQRWGNSRYAAIPTYGMHINSPPPSILSRVRVRLCWGWGRESTDTRMHSHPQIPIALMQTFICKACTALYGM